MSVMRQRTDVEEVLGCGEMNEEGMGIDHPFLCCGTVIFHHYLFSKVSLLFALFWFKVVIFHHHDFKRRRINP